MGHGNSTVARATNKASERSWAREIAGKDDRKEKQKELKLSACEKDVGRRSKTK